MLDEQTRDRLKQRLLDEKKNLEDQIARENQEVVDATRDQVNESVYSNHLGEAGPHLEEIDRTTSIRETLRGNLDQVNRALDRMEDGSYGLSEVSGKPIPVERLEALPWATGGVDEEPDTPYYKNRQA